jgi:hypothetical protein
VMNQEIVGPIGARLTECNSSSRIEFNPRLFYLLSILCHNPPDPASRVTDFG